MTEAYRQSTLIDSLGTGPPAVAEAASAIIDPDGKKTMIVYGGWLGNEGICSSEVWGYDLINKKWTKSIVTSKDNPGARCNMAYCTSDDSNLIIWGGQDTKYELHNDMWSLSLKSPDSQELTWIKHNHNNSPTPRCGASLCSDGGFLYLFGGTDGKTRLNDLHIYSPETLTWKSISTSGCVPPPTDAQTMVVDSNGSKLILFGGFGETHCGSLFTFNIKESVWVQEPRQPRVPPPRNSHRCHLINSNEQNILVVIMGYNGIELSDVWEIPYNQLSTSSWEASTISGDWPLPPRRYHTSCSVESKIIIFGGWNGKEYLDSTVEIDFAKPNDAAATKKK